MRVRCIGVICKYGDFGDLIGCRGVLTQGRRHMKFKPDIRGDWVVLEHAKATSQPDGLRVDTSAGNTFFFEVIPPDAASGGRPLIDVLEEQDHVSSMDPRVNSVSPHRG